MNHTLLYNRIEALCKNRGINVSIMCREAGVPRGSMTDLKSGRITGLSGKTLTSIANYFGVSIEEITQGRAPGLDEELTACVEVLRHAPALKTLVIALKDAPEEQVATFLRVLNALKPPKS